MSEILIENRGQFFDLIEGGNRVVALFTAPAWCIPCQRLEPHWNKAIEVAETNLLPELFVKVDMGETPEATGEHWASKDFDILGVPTVILFRSPDDYTRIMSRTVIPFLKEIRDA